MGNAERSPGLAVMVGDGKVDFSNIPGYDSSRAHQKLGRPHLALLRALCESPNPVLPTDLYDQIYSDALVGGDTQRIYNLVWEIKLHVKEATGGGQFEVIVKDVEDGGYLLAKAPLVARTPSAFAVVPCNIPTVQPSLIGREAEVEEYLHLLLDQRILQVIGPPGAGKSRIADEIGLLARSHFSDGVFKVPLAPIARGESILREIVRNVGYNVAPEDLESSLIQRFGDRSLLLVLDNFEHLLDQAPVVRKLVSNCPGLHVLVTSQRPFRVARGAATEGEVRRTLLPLATRLDDSPVSDIPAVRLFVGRARQATEVFDPDEPELQLILEICEQLGGLPLAIQLVAARCAAYSLETIHRLLRDAPFVVADGPDVEGRDSLRGAIAWTANLLGDSELRLLAWLSVFRGGFSFEAAEHVWAEAGESPADLLDVLERAVESSLVSRAPDRVGRYAMLEPIRLFFRDRLRTSKEEVAAQNALARWCLPLAKRLDEVLGGARSVEVKEQLESERANMRAAFAWQQSRGDALYVLELAIALSWFWTIHGDFNEGRESLATALAPEDVGAPRQRAMALNRLAGMTRQQGDFANAVKWYESARLLGKATGDLWNEGFALNGLGKVAASEGRFDDALASYEAALGIRRTLVAKEQRRTPAVAVTLDNLGDLHLESDVDDALERYREAHRLRHAAPDLPGIAISHLKLGTVAMKRGRHANARRWIRRALIAFDALGYRDWIASTFEELAKLAAAIGEWRVAARLWGAAESLDDLLGTVKSQPELEQKGAAVGMVQTALESAFWPEFKHGRSLELDEAVALALGWSRMAAS
jgi:predicted ATPase